MNFKCNYKGNCGYKKEGKCTEVSWMGECSFREENEAKKLGNPDGASNHNQLFFEVKTSPPWFSLDPAAPEIDSTEKEYFNYRGAVSGRWTGRIPNPIEIDREPPLPLPPRHPWFGLDLAAPGTDRSVETLVTDGSKIKLTTLIISVDINNILPGAYLSIQVPSFCVMVIQPGGVYTGNPFNSQRFTPETLLKLNDAFLDHTMNLIERLNFVGIEI